MLPLKYMRKLIILALFVLLAGTSANAGVIRLAAKGAKHSPHAAAKASKAVGKAAFKVLI